MGLQTPIKKDRSCCSGLLLVQLGPGSVHLPHDVGHARLVTHEGRQMRRLGRVVLRRKKAKAGLRPVAGGLAPDPAKQKDPGKFHGKPLEVQPKSIFVQKIQPNSNLV